MGILYIGYYTYEKGVSPLRGNISYYVDLFQSLK